ncbi:hypothetical protein [Weissella bombi]|uniref:Uncharacterized protein n=1 Tax=Weissella bombi TaxID=1505725 RepID=A0A1C4AR95_9LACO|nr:hypothetical protein [Weissella bombi]SCB96998.1 hypothetical protein GA0061074_10696 [Weissella bombi]
MDMTGNDFIEILTNETYKTKTFEAADQATINLDELFTDVEKEAAASEVFSDALVINEEEPIIFRIEASLINLPLRYTNAIRKIVVNDEAKEMSLYMIVEHPLVTKSHLLIKKASSVQSFLDDPTSVEEKITSFFNEQLAQINANKIAAAEEERAAAEQAATTENQ